MTDQELIQVLRSCGLSNGGSLGRHMGIMDIAADALEALQAENAEKDKEIEQLRIDLNQEHDRYIYTLGERDGLEVKSTVLQSRLDRMKAERDAAISDIKRCCDTCMWYQADSGGAIRRCRRGYEPSACMECVNWEWSGAQGVE